MNDLSPVLRAYDESALPSTPSLLPNDMYFRRLVVARKLRIGSTKEVHALSA